MEREISQNETPVEDYAKQYEEWLRATRTQRAALADGVWGAAIQFHKEPEQEPTA